MRTYCRLAGYANANDAYHQTASSQTGEGAYRAMAGRWHKAGCAAWTTSTSTARRPRTTTSQGRHRPAAAARRTGAAVQFDERLHGHALAAAGGIEAVLAVLAITHGLRYGNPGFAEPIPELGCVP